MTHTPLADLATIDAWLAKQFVWYREDQQIVCEIEFKDFCEAWSAMAQIALIAERLNHHPDWTNRYNRLVIALTTHDAGGLTHLDLEMAKAISEVLERY